VAKLFSVLVFFRRKIRHEILHVLSVFWMHEKGVKRFVD